jgi:molecular chaperone GrpE
VIQPDSEKENNSENLKSENGVAEENIEDLKKALTEATTKAEANLIGWQRAQADFSNYKRYAEQDKAETCKFANAGLLSSILPILDDFDRALATIPPEEKANWVEGLKLIDRKLRDTLTKQGVTPIQALGMEFDPRTMEAITVAKGQRDMVVQELERGYKLQDKVIRPAKVIVGNGEKPEEKEDLTS